MIQAIFSASAGAAGGFLGSRGKNEALAKQAKGWRDMLNYRQAWRDRMTSENATERADAQAAIREATKRITNRNRAAMKTAAVMGGTEESVAAAKAAGAQEAAEIASRIAAAGAERKDAIENEYMRSREAMKEKLIDIDGKRLTPWDIASNAIGGAANGLSKM